MKEKDRLSTKDQLLGIKEPLSYEEAAKVVGVGIDVIKATVAQLIKEGYGYAQHKDTFMRTKTKQEPGLINHSRLHDPRYLNFGIVSDTHLGSKKERVDKLEAMYDVFEKEGIHIVYHVGDLTDGWGVYKGQEFEVHKFGQGEQIEYAREAYPRRKNITTHFITGNHDLRQYERGGIDPGYAISAKRPDMKYMGQMYAQVKLPQGAIMELLHPAGGMAYAISYKAQRDINNRAPDELPEMLVYGHFHTSFYMHYRGIQFLQAPCFKEAGLFEKRLGLSPTLGGWLVSAEVSNHGGHINSFKPTLVKP